MRFLLLFLPLALFGKISFDFSNEKPKVLRSFYPAIKAAEMPPEKKIYTKEHTQFTHVTTGLQYENGQSSNMVDVSLNLGMSKKPLGVKESIVCFSFPKVMIYKKTATDELKRHATFFGAGLSYNGLINNFSFENEKALQAGFSMGLEYVGLNHSNHIFQIDFTQSIKRAAPYELARSTLPSTLIEFCYGAGF
ncbi:MAG: hypothetical protein ACOYK9_03065 [Chlamydiia bacterium]